MKTLTLNFDGGNAKGIATWAVIAKCNNEVVAKLTGLVDTTLPQTNNVAEWASLVEALKYATSFCNDYDEIKIFGDSQLIVRQFNGEYAVTKAHLKSFFEEARKIHWLLKPKNVSVSWIPREENGEADELGRILR